MCVLNIGASGDIPARWPSGASYPQPMPRTGVDPEWAFDQLVDALRLAALPADEHVAALPDFVHVADEIALLYEDAFLNIREAGVLTEDQVESLRALDQLFAEMTHASDRETIWTLAAMKGDERWARTRTLALAALAAIGAPPGRPHLDGTTWVEGS